MSDRMERARELMRAHNFQPQPHVLALMLAFADAELELAAAEAKRTHAPFTAIAIRNLKEE